MKKVNMLRYVTLRYVSHSFKLSRIFYCKNLLKNIFDLFGKSVIANALKGTCCQTKQSKFSKIGFYNLISLTNKFFQKWIASGKAFAMTVKNNFAILITRGFNPLRAFAIAHNGLKPHCYSGFASNFEIISRNENYAFNHNKNFCRNGNNIFLRNDYGKDF
ncbi:hypothetical protein, partial [Brachyspira catarrhinii]